MKFQSPKGTRDFYPQDMAWHNFLLDAWKRVSIRNGFEQVDGPIFETLDLYKVKSGEGIVSELFSFRRTNGSTDFALRPEFTPTLARMIADRANSLPKPIKWFCTSNFCRAERPQRGRLREFWQWNVDMLGLDSAAADAEVIFTAVDFFQEMGLSREQVKVKISHRDTVRHVLLRLGVPDDRMLDAFDLLDRRDKMEPDEFLKGAGELGLDRSAAQRFDEVCRMKYQAGSVDALAAHVGITGGKELDDLHTLDEQLRAFDIADWCEYDLGIVRGLAYYTGTVFEVHEISGVERAIAGGGRYDRLIELFGGPATPAVGFGMGDVVISNVLRDKLLAPEDVAPHPDAFVIALSDAGSARLQQVVSHLRRKGVHTRFSYKTTRNMGKLMKDAAGMKARFAVILDDKIGEGVMAVKDLASGEQVEVASKQLVAHLRGAGV